MLPTVKMSRGADLCNCRPRSVGTPMADLKRGAGVRRDSKKVMKKSRAFSNTGAPRGALMNTHVDTPRPQFDHTAKCEGGGKDKLNE